MTTEIKQGYICAACHGVTSEPNRDRIIHPGESDWTVLLSCPDCGHDEMDECSLCISCLECGEDTEATHDEYCKPHFDEEQMGEAEAQADSRKFDQPPHDAATATGMYDHDDIN